MTGTIGIALVLASIIASVFVGVEAALIVFGMLSPPAVAMFISVVVFIVVARFVGVILINVLAALRLT